MSIVLTRSKGHRAVYIRENLKHSWETIRMWPCPRRQRPTVFRCHLRAATHTTHHPPSPPRIALRFQTPNTLPPAHHTVPPYPGPLDPVLRTSPPNRRTTVAVRTVIVVLPQTVTLDMSPNENTITLTRQAMMSGTLKSQFVKFIPWTSHPFLSSKGATQVATLPLAPLGTIF